MTELDALIDRLMDADLKSQSIANLLSEHRTARAQEGKRCGDCYWWMKSRDCPKERNVQGYSRGPSSGAAICQKFQWCPLSKERADARADDRMRRAVELGVELP